MIAAVACGNIGSADLGSQVFGLIPYSRVEDRCAVAGRVCSYEHDVSLEGSREHNAACAACALDPNAVGCVVPCPSVELFGSGVGRGSVQGDGVARGIGLGLRIGGICLAAVFAPAAILDINSGVVRDIFEVARLVVAVIAEYAAVILCGAGKAVDVVAEACHSVARPSLIRIGRAATPNVAVRSSVVVLAVVQIDGSGLVGIVVVHIDPSAAVVLRTSVGRDRQVAGLVVTAVGEYAFVIL